MQRLITKDPIESDKRVEINWWLKEEGCDYCIHKDSKACDYCAYNKKRRIPYF